MLTIKAAWQASHEAIDELMNHSMSKRNEMAWNEMDKWMIQSFSHSISESDSQSVRQRTRQAISLTEQWGSRPRQTFGL